MLGHFCLAELCINFSPALQGGGWAEGGEGRVGVGGGEGGGKSFQVKTRATSCTQMVLITQLDRRDTIPVEGRIPDWLHPIGALHRCQLNVSIMVLQGTLQKSRPIESGHGRHAVQVANVCRYISWGKKINFNLGTN